MNACLILILILQYLYATESASNSLRPQFCNLEKETGLCRASISMYYYDRSQGKCRHFVYGGCGGNLNRFRTLQACKNTCEGRKCREGCFRIYYPVCGSDGKTYSNKCMLDVATCKSGGGIYQVHIGKCEDVCSMKPMTGLCRAGFTRYYYDSGSKKCKSFMYGGCGGNRNRFNTMQECQRKCGGGDQVIFPTN